jgi:hypothetical protein
VEQIREKGTVVLNRLADNPSESIAYSRFLNNESVSISWNRSFDKLDKHERDYKSQSIEEKESYRWIESSQSSQNHLKAADLVTIVADRESDIYEEFVMVPDKKTHLLIRSKHDRCLYDEKEKLFSHLSSQPVIGSYQFSLKGDRRRNRKGREALMAVRFTKVKIKRLQNLANHSTLPEYVELYGIEVREHPRRYPLEKRGFCGVF